MLHYTPKPLKFQVIHSHTLYTHVGEMYTCICLLYCFIIMLNYSKCAKSHFPPINRQILHTHPKKTVHMHYIDTLCEGIYTIYTHCICTFITINNTFRWRLIEIKSEYLDEYFPINAKTWVSGRGVSVKLLFNTNLSNTPSAWLWTAPVRPHKKSNATWNPSTSPARHAF